MLGTKLQHRCSVRYYGTVPAVLGTTVYHRAVFGITVQYGAVLRCEVQNRAVITVQYGTV